MVKKSQAKKQPLTLHGLLGALSFWGTATRAFLFGFLAFSVFLVALTEADSPSGVDGEVLVFIYTMGSFILLDFGYVLVSRAYRLQKQLDMLVVIIADTILGLLYIVPKVVVDQAVVVRTDPLIFVALLPVIVLSIRILLGMLFGSRQR